MRSKEAWADTASPEAVGMSSKRLERIEAGMRAHVDAGTVAGIGTVVSRRGEVVHAGQYGWQDREAGGPMGADTIFRIYSMTKPIVSTALMLLQEEGAFQLEHPVSRYLPAFGAAKVLTADGAMVDQVRPMAVQDLLTHTSGLTYDFMIDTPVAQMYRDARIMNDASRTLEEVVDVLAGLPLASQPGARWHYSVGIDVAAHLVQVLTDQPLGDFLAERLFGPLGMPDTAFGVAAAEEERLAAMYGLPDLFGRDHDATRLAEAALSGFNERIDVSQTYPADTPEVFARGGIGLFSTIGDYHRFAQMLANGGELDGERVAGRKTLELMHRNHLRAELLPIEIIADPMPGLGFGLGSRVVIDTAATAGPGTDGEYGWAGAAKTYYWVDPAEDLVGVFMAQYMTGVQTPDRDFRSLVYQAITD